MCLQYFEDPADPFRIQMPDDFSSAKVTIDTLMMQKERVSSEYKRLLRWFNVSAMKSSDFCLMWDNLLVPGKLLTSKSEKVKRNEMIPRFCGTKTLTSEDILFLWEFKKFDDPEVNREAPRR